MIYNNHIYKKEAMAMTTETSKIMDIKKACEYLGISRITMYRIIKSKKIECFKIGDGRGIYKFAAS